MTVPTADTESSSTSRKLVQGAKTRGKHTLATGHAASQPATIAVVADSAPFEEGDGWLMGVLSGIRSECHAADLRVNLVLEKAFPQTVTENGKPLGWVICPYQNMDHWLMTCDGLTVPWLTTRQTSRRQSHNFVTSDDFSAGRGLGVELAGRRLLPVCLAIETNSTTGADSELFQGILSGIIESGGAVADLMTRQGPESLWKFATASRLPRTVVCSNERMALLVCRLCLDRGLRIPDDVTLVLMGPSPLAGMAIPGLTSIERPAFMVGVECVRQLLSMIRSGSTRITGVHLPCEMSSLESLPPAESTRPILLSKPT